MSATASLGNGGWVRVDDPQMPGPVYLRYSLNERGRPIVTEFYVDGRGKEIRSSTLRSIDLDAFTAWAVQDHEWLKSTAQNLAGADLSRLASYFNTNFGNQAKHWIADSMRAQIPGSGVQQPKYARDPKRPTEIAEPAPLDPPIHGLTDDFMRSVAENYAWALYTRQAPAPMMAKQTGYSVRTAHSWIRKARARRFIALTEKGRRG